MELSQLHLKGKWSGKELNESFIYKGKKIIRISKKYFRPKDVNNLLGNSDKAKRILKWKPKITLDKLISEMIEEEMKLIK